MIQVSKSGNTHRQTDIHGHGSGPKHDMQFYKDNNIWQLYGEKLEVAEDNDHLGLVVSGFQEELKNIDKNIKSARDSLFSFLGNVFAYKCKLSQAVQYHTWSVFIKPVLRSILTENFIAVSPTSEAQIKQWA